MFLRHQRYRRFFRRARRRAATGNSISNTCQRPFVPGIENKTLVRLPMQVHVAEELPSGLEERAHFGVASFSDHTQSSSS